LRERLLRYLIDFNRKANRCHLGMFFSCVSLTPTSRPVKLVVMGPVWPLVMHTGACHRPAPDYGFGESSVQATTLFKDELIRR